MPLLKGKKNVGKNISELMKSYKETGKIGDSKPKNKKKAHKQALAISLNAAGISKKNKSKKKVKKFNKFLESISTSEHQLLMESIKTGFKIIFEARTPSEPISLEDARKIAAKWHSGQWSPLYSFASTGKVVDDRHKEDLITEIDDNIYGLISIEEKTDLSNLLDFVDILTVGKTSELVVTEGVSEEDIQRVAESNEFRLKKRNEIMDRIAKGDIEGLDMDDVPMTTHSIGTTPVSEIAERFALMQKLEGHDEYPIKLNESDTETVERASEDSAFGAVITPWERTTLDLDDLQNLLKALYIYWENTNDDNAISLRTGILITLRIEEV